MNYRHQAISSLLTLVFVATAQLALAQTFTGHVSEKENGKASVTIIQSQEIEKLVNRRPATADNKKQTDNQAKKEADKKERENAAALLKQHDSEQQHKQSRTETDVDADDDDMSIPTVDMRKKVMRNSYKVPGYRVQAFAGRNSKADRIKAESVGNAIKMKYPDQPVYVHFYSPRWICRVGNYRSYEEASKMLHLIQAMGYKSATIVKGQITVKKQ